jgi:CheY-like chemotaxis protein
MTSLAQISVLIVDDNQSMRSIASSVLISMGIRNILEAADGATALAMLQNRVVDLALVDFNMRPLDGIEFTRLVRNSPDAPQPYLPIIMMTGHADKTRVNEARDAGVTEFMVKPITAKALIDRMQAIIMRPRPFIKTDEFFGPDRRRSTNPAKNRNRRRSDLQSIDI